jgi:hypothetical protein
MFTPFHKTIPSSIPLMRKRVTTSDTHQTPAAGAENPNAGHNYHTRPEESRKIGGKIPQLRG